MVAQKPKSAAARGISAGVYTKRDELEGLGRGERIGLLSLMLPSMLRRMLSDLISR